MAHDPTRIKGYRNLSDEEIAVINGIKTIGLGLQEAIGEIGNLPGVDLRWVIEAENHLKIGMMLLTRAVAKPEGF